MNGATHGWIGQVPIERKLQQITERQREKKRKVGSRTSDLKGGREKNRTVFALQKHKNMMGNTKGEQCSWRGENEQESNMSTAM